MNWILQLAVAYGSAVLTMGVVAVVAHGLEFQSLPDASRKPSIDAAKSLYVTPPAYDIGRHQQMWQSSQEHFRQMDRIRARTW